ncbi:MAG: hypothetical protein WBC70_07510 [Candidatus Aminicenantales bacterium]
MEFITEQDPVLAMLEWVARFREAAIIEDLDFSDACYLRVNR